MIQELRSIPQRAPPHPRILPLSSLQPDPSPTKRSLPTQLQKNHTICQFSLTKAKSNPVCFSKRYKLPKMEKLLDAARNQETCACLDQKGHKNGTGERKVSLLYSFVQASGTRTLPVHESHACIRSPLREE